MPLKAAVDWGMSPLDTSRARKQAFWNEIESSWTAYDGSTDVDYHVGNVALRSDFKDHHSDQSER